MKEVEKTSIRRIPVSKKKRSNLQDVIAGNVQMFEYKFHYEMQHFDHQNLMHLKLRHFPPSKRLMEALGKIQEKMWYS